MLSYRFSLLTLAVSTALLGRAYAQDDCTAAVAIGIGATAGTNVGSTTSLPAWPCGAGANDVWYVFTAPSAGTLIANTCGGGTAYDSTIEVFDGAGGCGALVSLGCNDDFCGLQSQVTATIPAAGPVYIRVGGFGGATGAFVLNVNFGTTATVVSQGPGCFGQFASFYELSTVPTFDLTGQRLTFTNTGTGYVATIGPGTLNPVGAGAVNLALTDDSSIAAGTLGLTVGSNCWVATGPGNSTGFVPSAATFLSNPAAAFYSWRDLNPAPAGSGPVKYEETGTVATVTYDGTYTFGTTQPNFIQIIVDTATGNASITWGTQGTTGAGVLVGYSPAGPNLDPGSIDISSIVAVVTQPDIAPLSLTAIGRPVQGPAAVNFDVTTGNIPAGALVHVGILGLSRPGLPLGLLLGATDCFLNASADVLIGTVVLPPASVTWTALPLPALPPDFSGFEFNVQGAILGTSLNPAIGGLGLLTSNGLKCTVGTL